MPRKTKTAEPCCQPGPGSCCSPRQGDPEACCPDKPLLEDRPLLTPEQAGELSGIFSVLANDTRLRLLHALHRAGELCVGELAEVLAMKPQAVSNQLQRLSDLGIVASKRNGTSIRYRIADCCVTSLLDRGLCLMEDAWKPWQRLAVERHKSTVV